MPTEDRPAPDASASPDAADASALPVWLLRLAYDGSPYSGWQSQPAAPTVQAALDLALARMYTRDWRRRQAAGEPIPTLRTQGCSRTDAGVHALCQLVSVTPPASPTIPPDGALKALNGSLPPTIRVRDISVREPGFHARHAAVGKAYTYLLHRGRLQNPFLAPYLSPCPPDLDVAAMRAATSHLVGAHDFRNFTVNSDGQNPTDTIRSLDRFVLREHGRILSITVVGERFLYRMVRRLVGCLLAVGEGRLAPSAVPAYRDGPDRDGPVQTALPQGLYLEDVFLDPATMAAFTPGPLPFLGLLGLPDPA